MRLLPFVLVTLVACGSSQGSDTTPAAAAGPEAESAPPEAPVPAAASAPEAAEQGATLYGAKCASCHGDAGQGGKAPAVVGKAALPLDPRPGSKRGGQFKTALDVFQFVKTAMPGDAPGSLTDDEYRAIIAFDLKANGVDLGAEPFTAERAATFVLHP